jgi:hypothetical protein
MLRVHFHAGRTANRTSFERERPDDHLPAGKPAGDFEHRNRPRRIQQLKIRKNQNTDRAPSPNPSCANNAKCP